MSASAAAFKSASPGRPVTAGLRERPGLAAVSAHEVAAHLSGGLWLAPGEPVLEFNASVSSAGAMSPS